MFYSMNLESQESVFDDVNPPHPVGSSNGVHFVEDVQRVGHPPGLSFQLKSAWNTLIERHGIGFVIKFIGNELYGKKGIRNAA